MIPCSSTSYVVDSSVERWAGLLNGTSPPCFLTILDILSSSVETIHLSIYFDSRAASKDQTINGLSTSGNSLNIVNAAKFSNLNHLKVISLTGNNGGNLKNYSIVNINIESDSTQRIQEMHILIGHILCDIIEKKS